MRRWFAQTRIISHTPYGRNCNENRLALSINYRFRKLFSPRASITWSLVKWWTCLFKTQWIPLRITDRLRGGGWTSIRAAVDDDSSGAAALKPHNDHYCYAIIAWCMRRTQPTASILTTAGREVNQKWPSVCINLRRARNRCFHRSEMVINARYRHRPFVVSLTVFLEKS